jgi:hypothetical protein
LVEYWEWDGETHLEDSGIWDLMTEERWMKDATTVIHAFCDCFHFKGCCSVTFNHQALRAGDRIYYRDGKFELVRGDTEPFICPVHEVEHKGTGRFLCTVTGQHE